MTSGVPGSHAAGFDEGGRPDVSGASVGELIGKVSQDFSTLMRQEVALAKAELRSEVSVATQGVGMLVGAGIAGFFLLLFLSNALWWALENV
ncbi:phage holin family protein, partial [Corallococcus sp. AB004]